MLNTPLKFSLPISQAPLTSLADLFTKEHKGDAHFLRLRNIVVPPPGWDNLSTTLKGAGVSTVYQLLQYALLISM